MQHLVELGVGVWPSQPSSKWWRLWGVLWGFGAAQESLSQAQGLGQGGTCSTLPLLTCWGSTTSAVLESKLANPFGFETGVGGGGGQKTKDPSFTWVEMRLSGCFNSPWDLSGGKCQLPRGGARLTMEFSSGFHSVSVGVEFIYEMMQQIGVQFLQAQSKKGSVFFYLGCHRSMQICLVWFDVRYTFKLRWKCGSFSQLSKKLSGTT